MPDLRGARARIEMAAQALDITRRMRADWVVAHLFGRSPSVSIKELKKTASPWTG